MTARDNIVLIGMPGAGKSTVGLLLAKQLGLAFVDTDVLLQQREGRRLQEIVDAEGSEVLRQLEADLVQGLLCERTVVATGGSVVYDADTMEHLTELGCVVWLKVPFEVIEARVALHPDRGIARGPDQSLADVFAERQPLYEQCAQLTVDAGGPTLEATVARILDALARMTAPEGER